MSITKTFQREIISQLNYEYLNCDDFNMVIIDTGFGPKVEIKYRYDEIYYYSFELIEDGSYYVTKSPGEISLNVSYKMSKASNLFPDIKEWLVLLEKEISATPVVRQFFSFKEEIDNQLINIETLINEQEDKYFSRLEAEELVNKLNKLESDFIRQMEKEIEDKERLQAELDIFQKEITFLKNQLDGNTKRNWLKAFSTKALRWGKNNPNTVKAIGGIVREMLPENIKRNIPSELIEVIPQNNLEEAKN